MILPTKHLRTDRSIIGSGGEILTYLDEPKQISRIWDEIKKSEKSNPKDFRITYDWFILSMDFLYLLGVVEINDGIITKVKS